MLKLEGAKILGQGMERICYLHPDDANKVIKIPKTQSPKSIQQNQKEYRSFQYISKRHKKLTCISGCYGFVETDLGSGLVCQCIRNFQGSISKSLFEILILQHNYPYDRLVHCVNELCSFLLKENIQLFDLNPKNIVINVQKDGAYKAISIDLKGRYANNEFIPFSTYIPFFSRKKILRRWQQLLVRMEYFRDNNHLFLDEFKKL